MELLDVLIEIDGLLSDGTATYIMRQGRYFSGIPYRWSNFGERAYIFPSRAYAERLIARFPADLAGATVHQRFPERQKS